MSLTPPLAAAHLSLPRWIATRMRVAHFAPGLLLAVAIGLLSMVAAQLGFFADRGISALTLSIVAGLAIGNTVYPRFAATLSPGVGFSKQRLLRLGIVLYGLRLTFQDIGHIGWAGVAIDAVVLCSTFGLAWWLGTRVLGLDRDTALLIGAGSSICGAAAVLATAPVLKARAEQVAVAVATVVVFGTLAMFLYPALFSWAAPRGLMPGGDAGYGLFVGSTVHEVAQVVAAGRAVSEHAADSAVIAKMVRVMMLAPFLLLLSAWLARHPGQHEGTAPSGQATAVAIPWFAVCFIAVAGLNSTGLLPAALADALRTVGMLLLAAAMAALGLTTHVSAIRCAGMKPLVLAGVLFAWLVGGGYAINRIVMALAG